MQQEAQVDASAVIAGLLDRLGAVQLEAVQLRVLLAQQETELNALRAASAPAELAPAPAVHTLPRAVGG